MSQVLKLSRSSTELNLMAGSLGWQLLEDGWRPLSAAPSPHRLPPLRVSS